MLLLLLLLPALWYWMRRVPEASRLCLALKCAVFALLVLALAGPRVLMRASKLAVTLVMDASASMPRESLQRGQTMLRDLVSKRTGADLRLITFDGSARLRPVPAQAANVSIPQGVNSADGMKTDLEGALQLALDTFPDEGARRVLLISDGNENQGDALSAALRARERGVSIFSAPSGGMAPLPVTTESVASPEEVLSGEHFTLSLELDGSRPVAARVWVTADGQEVGSTTMDLKAGDNTMDLDAQIVKSGLALVEGHISSAGAEQTLFSQAIAVRRPQVLDVAGSGEVSGALLQTLKAAEIDVKEAAAFPVDASKQDWDAVLLDNYPDHELSPEEESAIEQYVSKGGGLIFIAGDKNAKLARDSKTPLQKLLPVRAHDPKEKPAAVVLVLDKSGSMEGRTIGLVREAARASLVTLPPMDRAGVIEFDQAFDWVIPMGTAADVQSKLDLIDKIDAGGNTNIYQPLLAAYQAVLPEPVSSRHIILLTDGDQTPFTFQDFAQLEVDAAKQNVVISAIGLGDHVNEKLLNELADKTKGKAHFIENPMLIPQVVSDEVQSTDDLAIQERPVRAIRVRPVEMADGIDFSQAPGLLGFVQAQAKDSTETILGVDRDKPLLVRWQYGLGSVVAFMSDGGNRWATPWASWKSFGTLWPQMVRSVVRQDQAIRAGARMDEQDGEAVVAYDVKADAAGPAVSALSNLESSPLVLETPDGATSELHLAETAPGHYEARIPAAQRGLYRVASSDPQLSLPEVGFYHDVDELKPQPVNLALLGEISRVTGGRVNPSIDQLLDDRGSLVEERASLWPYLVILALALNFVEVAFRRGLLKWARARAS